MTISTNIEKDWRKAIAEQVRRNCTLLPREDGTVPRDDTIRAVADWIENPPEWSTFERPAAASPEVAVRMHSAVMKVNDMVLAASLGIMDRHSTPAQVQHAKYLQTLFSRLRDLLQDEADRGPSSAAIELAEAVIGEVE